MVSSKGGFNLFSYWYNLYQSATGEVLPPYETFPTDAKKSFNSVVKMWKDRNTTKTINSLNFKHPVNNEYIKALLAYALYHDPYQRGPKYYGAIQLALSTNSMFVRWLNNHEDEVKEEGILQVVLAYVPEEKIKFEYEDEENLTPEDFLIAFDFVDNEYTEI